MVKRCLLALALMMGFMSSAFAEGFSLSKDKAPIREIETRPIQIKTVDGTIFDANVGFIDVPENRKTPESRTIKVAFMQVLSPTRTSDTPVFQFHGGPDDNAHLSHKIPLDVMNYLDAEGPVLVDFSLRSRGYRDYLDFTDVVIIDDRGMGHSQPRLTCTDNPKPADFMKPTEEQRVLILSYIERCREEHAEAGADLAGYTITEVAHDFEDLRQALGYGKVVVQGSSFGSQTAFAVMKMFPDSVARAYLGGLEGLSDTYDYPIEIQDAVTALIHHANGNSALRRQLPRQDMGHTLKTIFTNLEERPRTIVIKGPNGEPAELLLDHRTVGQVLLSLGMLRYRGDTPPFDDGGASEILPTLLALYYEAYDGIAHLLAKELGADEEGVTLNASALAIDCASGVSPARRAEIATQGAALATDIMFTPLGFEGLVRGNPDFACEAMKVPDLGDAWREDTASSVPVLFVHGDFDGATPPNNAARLIRKFDQGKLIMVQGAAHYRLEMEYLSPELKEWRRSFVETGTLPDDLPQNISLPPIEFDTVPTPVLWAFKLGLGNQMLRFAK